MKILNKNPFEDKNLSWINSTEEKALQIESENSIIEIINEEFDYNIMDEETSSFLKLKEIEMQEIMIKTYTEIGRVLLEAQERLAKSGYGCFLEWTKSLGFKKDKVYSLISRYKLILSFGNSERRNLVENIPLSLSYEISKRNVDKELKEMVLNGDIKTLKEYKEYKGILVERKNDKIDILTTKDVLKDNFEKIKIELAEFVSHHRSYDEKSDYLLAEELLKQFNITKK